jgi:Ca-activated chloride channel family protein
MTIVLDRSGSMQGAKFEQAKKAAGNVINGLVPGERFNIVDYSDSIEMFAKEAVALDEKTRAEAIAYLGRLQSNGGTNLNDALLAAITPKPQAGSMPLVLFLTDGLPTVGERREAAIRDNINAANTNGRRIFTFGVGFDVNTPLLSGIARGAKGAPTFILPDEDVEVKVSQVSKRLRGPTLGNPTMVVIGADGKPTTRAVRELQPAALDDVFEGDQIVVLGQYTGEQETLTINLGGEYFGTPRTFEFALKTTNGSAANGYVPRLWATRKVAALVEEIRQASAEPGSTGTDARTKELVEQITQLSLRWGVMTPYTSFIATEDLALLGDIPQLNLRVLDDLAEQSQVRAGLDGVLQEQDASRKLTALNAQSSNTTYAIAPSAPASGMFYAVAPGGGGGQNVYASVQNINAQTYYNRSGKWVDGRVVSKEAEPAEIEVVVGTEAFTKVADALIAEGQAGVLSLEGDVLVMVGGKRTLIRREAPKPETPK